MRRSPYYEKATDELFRVEQNFLRYNIPAHFHKAIEFQYILKKNYKINIQGTPVTVKKNEILIIPSRIIHSAAIQEEVQTIMVLIPYDFFAYFPTFQRTTAPFFILNDINFNKRVLPILRLLVRKFDDLEQANTSIRDSLSIGWTNLIYAELFSHYRLSFMEKGKNAPDFFDQVLGFIDQHYMDPDLSLQSIAKYFKYNPSYISRSFKNGFSVPLNQHIRSVRIQKFISLYPLQENPNILNLALQCGFSSLAAFYRAFHAETNLAPKEYFSQENSYLQNNEEITDIDAEKISSK